MDSSEFTWQERTEAMTAELASLSYAAAIGWGASRFGGAAFDNLFSRLTHNPDGSKSDPVVETERVSNWVEYLAAYVAILRAKAG